MTNFITAAEFRAVPLGVSLKQITDEQLDELISVAQENVEAFCDRHFASAYYTEEWMGDGSTKYITEEYPIISVVTLTQTDPSSGTVTSLDITKLRNMPLQTASGIIELDGYDTVTTFSTAYKYSIYYRAGYTTIPVAIKHATKLWTAELLQPDFAGATTTTPNVIPITTEQITELLIPYKRQRIW